MTQSENDFPTLANLIGGWFHQDYDIAGEEVEDIIKEYNKVCSTKQRFLLIEELERFMEKDKETLDDEFISVFSPDIIATEFAPTTLDFLQEILLHVKNDCVVPPDGG